MLSAEDHNYHINDNTPAESKCPVMMYNILHVYEMHSNFINELQINHEVRRWG